MNVPSARQEPAAGQAMQAVRGGLGSRLGVQTGGNPTGGTPILALRAIGAGNGATAPSVMATVHIVPQQILSLAPTGCGACVWVAAQAFASPRSAFATDAAPSFAATGFLALAAMEGAPCPAWALAGIDQAQASSTARKAAFSALDKAGNTVTSTLRTG